jgi:hypothetical protein
MTAQLPAVIPPSALIVSSDTYIVPALIAAAGDAAGWRFVEFFTANINNDHTRRAYARACHGFFGWWVGLRKGTQNDIAPPRKAPKSAVYAGSCLPISPSVFRPDFEGAFPSGEEVPPPSKGRGVPKTLELGTTGYKSDASGKALKIVFQNDVRKLMF